MIGHTWSRGTFTLLSFRVRQLPSVNKPEATPRLEPHLTTTTTLPHKFGSYRQTSSGQGPPPRCVEIPSRENSTSLHRRFLVMFTRLWARQRSCSRPTSFDATGNESKFAPTATMPPSRMRQPPTRSQATIPESSSFWDSTMSAL